jgi:hypothetical protein
MPKKENILMDSDLTTFSSSTAKLEINNSCKRIVFAGLYWASIYPNEVRQVLVQFYGHAAFEWLESGEI